MAARVSVEFLRKASMAWFGPAKHLSEPENEPSSGFSDGHGLGWEWIWLGTTGYPGTGTSALITKGTEPAVYRDSELRIGKGRPAHNLAGLAASKHARSETQGSGWRGFDRVREGQCSSLVGDLD